MRRRVRRGPGLLSLLALLTRLAILREGVVDPDLPRKPIMASGQVMPADEGTRNGARVLYVDSVNGSNGNNGTSWGLAKAGVFGATGALAAANDGDTILVRGAHSEVIAGVNAVSKNYIKIVPEGPRDAFERFGITFSGAGASISVSGNGNEFYFLRAEGIEVASPAQGNYFYRCETTGAGGWTVGGTAQFNFFDRCGRAGTVTVSGLYNIWYDPSWAGGTITFDGLSSNNVVWRPYNQNVVNVLISVAGQDNMFFDVPLGGGPHAFSVRDSGTRNLLIGKAESATRLIENVHPEVGTAAVVVTGAAGAGAYGASTQIMTDAAAPANDYEFVGIVALLNQVDDYQIEVSDNVGNVLGEFSFNASAVATRFSEKLVTPVRVRGGIGVQARLKTTGGASDTANMRVKFRT